MYPCQWAIVFEMDFNEFDKLIFLDKNIEADYDLLHPLNCPEMFRNFSKILDSLNTEKIQKYM